MDIAAAAALAGVIIGGMGVLATIWATITQRLIDRRKTTIEYLSNQVADRDMMAARRLFIQISNEGTLERFADKASENSDETLSILAVLNQFELISIGIQDGSLDYGVYEKYNRMYSLSFWDRAAPFIRTMRFRLENDRIYSEFEKLAYWLGKSLNPPRWSRMRPLFW